MKVELTKERREAYVEVLAVLDNMELKYVEMIPEELLTFFKANKSEEYKFELIPGLQLKEQQLMNKTLTILAMLNLYYWCTDDKHKQEMVKKFIEAEQQEEDLKVAFIPENIFNNQKDETKVVTNASELVVCKSSLFERFVEKIRKIFSRKSN